MMMGAGNDGKSQFRSSRDAMAHGLHAFWEGNLVIDRKPPNGLATCNNLDML